MILETLLVSLVGVGIGIFTMTPGIHINTVIPLILSATLFLNLDPYVTIVLIVSIAITEGFIDLIPSIFLGAPDEDTALSVLPGHRLLLDGRGREAIKLGVIGALGSIICTLALTFLFIDKFTYLYEVSRPYIHYVIICVILFMIFSEKKWRKMLLATSIISLSGIFGVITLNSSLIPQQNILFPVFTGMFGLSTLITSVTERAKIPKQEEDTTLKISKPTLVKSILLSSIGGITAGFLPAVGISEIAIMLQYLGGSLDPRSFLVMVPGINSANDFFSMVSLYLMSNPRSGASVAIQRVLGELTFPDVIYLFGVMCFVAGIAAELTLFLSSKIPKYLERVNYRKLCLSIIALITFLMFVLTGPFGLLIAFTSTAIGMLCIQFGVRRSHCMGTLLLPSILFFTGLNPFVLSILKI